MRPVEPIGKRSAIHWMGRVVSFLRRAAMASLRGFILKSGCAAPIRLDTSFLVATEVAGRCGYSLLMLQSLELEAYRPEWRLVYDLDNACGVDNISLGSGGGEVGEDGGKEGREKPGTS